MCLIVQCNKKTLCSFRVFEHAPRSPPTLLASEKVKRRLGSEGLKGLTDLEGLMGSACSKGPEGPEGCEGSEGSAESAGSARKGSRRNQPLSRSHSHELLSS